MLDEMHVLYSCVLHRPSVMLITHLPLTNSEQFCGWGFSGGSVVGNPPANAADLGVIRGARRPLEKEMATHSSGSLAWEIPRLEKPGGLQSMGSQNSQTQLGDSRTTILWVTGGRAISSHYCHHAKVFLLQRQNMASPNSREERRGTRCPWQPGLASIMNHCGLILTGPVTA